MLTIALSGPADTRAHAEVALEDARVPVYPADHHAPMDWNAKFPGDTDEWITVEHEDPGHVASIVEPAGWRLRVHYETPEAPRPTAAQIQAATIAEMRAELDALKARVR